MAIDDDGDTGSDDIWYYNEESLVVWNDNEVVLLYWQLYDDSGIDIIPLLILLNYSSCVLMPLMMIIDIYLNMCTDVIITIPWYMILLFHIWYVCIIVWTCGININERVCVYWY